MNKTQRNLLENVVIVDAGNTAGIRTAITKARRGGFKNVRPDDLAAHVIKEILERTKVDPKKINDIRLGCAFPEGPQGMQVARIVVFVAGLPVEIPAITINRYCCSGLQAIWDEVTQIAIGDKTIAVAGGLETMTMVPMGGRGIAPNPKLVAEWPGSYLSMGLTAERLAEQDNNTRKEQDKFALESNQKAIKALDKGKWKNEILPYEVKDKKIGLVDTDEGPRRNTSMEGLANLPTPFKENGTVTAGNSSQMSDGAAVVMVMTIQEAEKLGLKPLARLIAYKVAGVPPEIMGIGPVEAIPKALKAANLKIDDMDIIELNEAFASQSISVIKRLKKEKKIELPLDRLNVNGGAIALGHPLGCTGCYLTIKGLNETRRRKGQYAMITMCIGGGMGAAGIFELLY